MMCETKMNDVARYGTLLFYKYDDQIGGLEEKDQKELDELEEKLMKNEKVIERLEKEIEELKEECGNDPKNPVDCKYCWTQGILQKILGEEK